MLHPHKSCRIVENSPDQLFNSGFDPDNKRTLAHGEKFLWWPIFTSNLSNSIIDYFVLFREIGEPD